MARRKGISSNTNKTRGVLAVASQHTREPTTRDAIMGVGTENRNDNPGGTHSEKPREEFHALNNNNDNRYLHKKFKKMATAVQPVVLQVDVGLSRSASSLFDNISNQSTSHLSSSQEVPPARRTMLPSETSSEHALAPITMRVAIATAKSNEMKISDAANNVQINHKDYNDKRVIAIAKDNNGGVSFDSVITNKIENKILNSGEIRETETNLKDSSINPGNGRHVCPYCKLSCAKPSVLQKHIRAHTNERPYPCVPCGFAFKTKSNLYKHCRSRSHALRLQGAEETANTDEEWSLGSEADVNVNNTSRPDSVWSNDKNSLHGGEGLENINELSTDLSMSDCISPFNIATSQIDSRPKSIYKPKFHKATFYQEEDETPKRVLSPNPDLINRHISKIISDNEAIVDTLMSPLNVKYSKDMINHKICHNDIISDSHDPLKSDNVPLNLTKNNENDPNHRKRCYSESFATPESLKGPQHPLNPEGSIIKDLLLKARAQATGLLPVTSETYDASETLYICPVCQIPYRSADNLEIHRLYYCKGNSVSSNATLNGALLNMRDIHKLSRPEHSYIRSNSVHVTLPETYNPNTLAKLASSTLKCPSGRTNKPENLVIIKSDIEVAAPLPSPGPLLGNTRLIDTQSISESQRLSAYSNYDINLKVNMMSPISKQRTDSHSCESFSSLSKISEESLQRSELYSPPSKMRCTETPTTLRSLEELSLSPMRQNSTSLQMFGGEVKIVDTAGGTTTLRIEPTTSQHSPTLISQSRASPKTLGPETSSIVVRSGLHSGGTMVHNPPTPKEPLLSPLPPTPRLVVSMTPNISTPTLTVSGMPTQNITKFQFPPISSITAYNPLTLPPKSPVASPSGASTIIHGGKLIPYVPGIPGPNSLNTFIPNVQKLSQKMAKSIEALNNNFGSGSIRDDQNHFENIVNKALVSPDVDHNVKLQSPRSKFKISNLILNHNTEKREASGRPIITSPFIASPISPGLKFVPNVKMNYENAVSPKNLNSDFTLSKQSKAQNKIDSILRKNTEILQRSNSVDSPSNKILSVQSEHKIFVPYRPSFFDDASNTAEKIPIIKINEKEIRLPAKAEMRQFNFENLISKSEILNKAVDVTISDIVSNSSKSIKVDDPSTAQERSETAYFKKSVTSLGSAKIESQKSKFLRPTSLPLKPGTFTPKRHHGITPNANTLPLISPETPRPAKAYGQLYLNGHAYTYLGLKCSTKVYYCTLNRPQPTYVQNQHALSMYSNWQVCSEATPHPLGLAPGRAMSHYDSRHRPQNTTVAKIKQDHMMTHSSQWSVTVAKQQSSDDMDEGDDLKKGGDQAWGGKNSKGLTGGFESNEEYTYVRGRGRGRYVCYECGIRCKKPSMLKKHIRTHTDVRPFTCKHCAFSFKTKGNLTKHMKSKAHYKKCCELGISPLEDNEGGDMNQGTGGESDDDSESDDDGNEGETESSDTDSSKSRLEHEAAHCLLSLYEGRPAPGLVSSARPTTYPYTPNHTDMQTTPVDDSKPTAVGVITQNGEVIQSMIRKQCSAQTIFKQEKIAGNHRSGNQNFHPIDLSKPIDLSIADAREEESRVDKTSMRYPAADMLTPVGEPDLLVSLAMNTGKLPQRQSRWHDDEPMLQAYLTEKALQDSKIKQSQYANGRPQQMEANSAADDVASLKNTVVSDTASGIDPRLKVNFVKITEEPSNIIQTPAKTEKVIASHIKTVKDNTGMDTLAEIAATSVRLATPPPGTSSDRITPIVNLDVSKSTENAKFVASEYLKVACGKQNENVDANVNSSSTADKKADKPNTETGSFSKADDVSVNEKDSDKQKPNPEHIGVARNVVVGAGGVGFTSPSNEFSSVATYAKRPLTEDGRSVCVVCNKTFSKPSQLCLHINIHFMERPFRCSACAVSFRTHGHLQKHERSGSHHNKVSMTSTFGAATTTNPRPFKCSDCKIAFRIHGHLAKHLRSKMHVMRLECLGKLPFGTFAEIERAGVSLTDIDTTDCDNSLASLQILAQKLHEKDPSKLDKWDPSAVTPALLPPGPDSSDDDEPSAPSPRSDHNHGGSLDSRAKTVNDGDSPDEMNVKYSATDT